MKSDHQPDHVKVILFRGTKVTVLEQRGDPNLIGDIDLAVLYGIAL
ncbi:MAG: hypothetical protein AAGN15_15800 [Cyanobacteria bacterium J06581_3]